MTDDRWLPMLYAAIAVLGLGITPMIGAQQTDGTPHVMTGPEVERYYAALRLGSNGNLRRARDELDAVLRADSTHTSARLRLRTLNDVSAGVIVPMTAIHLFRAAQNSQDGRHTAAIAEIDSAIRLNPRYDEAFRLRGRTRVELQDFQPAIQDYNHAIALNPRNAVAFLNRGVALVHLRDWDRALQDFNAAIQLEPRNPDCVVNRGVLYATQRLFQQALADFDKAIELDSGAAPAYANKALILEQIERWEEALRTYRALVRNARPGYSQLVGQANGRIRDLERR